MLTLSKSSSLICCFGTIFNLRIAGDSVLMVRLMAGRHAGVATKIRELESRAIYIHCMGHSMKLAVQDTCRSIAVMADAFDTVLELSKIFRYSPKKKAMLLKL